MEKRGLDDGAGPSDHNKRQKIPALGSVIVEALKVDSLQKLCSSLEPILRRVVSEEVERALAKLGPARLGGRSSPKRIEEPNRRNLHLQFTTRLSLPLFTGGKVEGEQGAAIHVLLRDANTGCFVTSGPESSVKLDIVVLEGDFNNEDEDGWTEEEFENYVVKEREGKRPLLTGDLQVTLKEGVGTLGEFTFTDNSSWIRSRKFRLGLRIASNTEGIRIREAKTEAFTVKDHRGELYKKHYPPNLIDEVWRLEKIGKDGAFHKRLIKASISTVEDFLRLYVRDSQQLRNILGGGMSNRMWESLVDHAKTCVLSGKHYVYYSDDKRNIGAIFNNVYEFRGLIADGHYYSAETLSDGQKVFVDSLVKKAYDNWMHVIEYDGDDSFDQKKMEMSGAAEVAKILPNYAYNQQVSQPPLQNSFSTTEQGGHMDLTLVGGNYGVMNVSPNSNVQFPVPQYFDTCPQSAQMTRNDSAGLALGPPQTNLEFEPLGSTSSMDSSSNHNSYWSNNRDDGGGYADFLTEDEIRMKSNEILENEDMRQLLRVLSMGGSGTAPNLTDEEFRFPPFVPTPTPNYNFDEERSSRSGKAFVGWLKIKAAMRWGIFIRKKAAERRKAQLVELDD